MATDPAIHQQQFDRIATGKGFIAALDQSGGSTPKALAGYGVSEDEWDGILDVNLKGVVYHRTPGPLI